ncbi:MAG: SusD/RagB family nutrient-binding outer membrane lipoprotein, partial [Bacteroidota bacterium]
YYGDNVYSWGSGSFDPYLVMKNVAQMEAEATKRGAADVNPYRAIGRFIKAYYYYNLTSLFGDVPQEDALKPTETTAPAYTSQEKVFVYILSQLDSANSDFASLISSHDNSLSGAQDLYYSGNLVNWQKAVNTFKLRMLVSLSHQAGDAALNVPTQFAAILNNPTQYPIFSSQDDDLSFKYDPDGKGTYSTYPFNPNSFGSIAARYNTAYTYVHALTSINDPRVFVTCEPAWGLVGSDIPNAAQFKYFVGASTGEDVAIMYNKAGAGEYSFINRKRYYSTSVGEPNVLVGYKEMCFNIAEGITRGWASGNAETWYKKGITESMSYYGIDVTQPGFTAYFFVPGSTNPVTDPAPYSINFDFATYYAQPQVALSATAATAVNQIVTQKYLAMFQTSGWEAYYNWRRTGAPAFENGVGVGNSGVVPKRWGYPTGEQTQNKDNWTAALSAQQFSGDDLNQIMWLVK